jgi:transposase
VIDTTDLNQLEAPQLGEMVRSLASSVVTRDREITFKQALIDKLTHENAVLKRLKFAAKSEAYSAEQKSLLEETLDMDLAAVAAEIEALQPERAPSDGKQQPKRAPLPAHLPRREVRHEPDDTTCGCGKAMQRIGEDVAEKLDYQPGVFTVERHIRGKWACACCERLVQAPVAAHVIDKGIPTTGLLAQVLVAKYLDHLPLHRQERVFERAGMAIALTPADARSIIASGRMAVFVGCESGFDHEGDTLVLEALYRLGLRTVQFATQTGFNAFADSATAPLQGVRRPFCTAASTTWAASSWRR